MPSAEVVVLPQTQDDECLQVYAQIFKDVRLRALKQDPQAFRATYKDESNQSDEFWVKRLRTSNVRHILAVQCGAQLAEPVAVGAESRVVGIAVLQAGDPLKEASSKQSDFAIQKYHLMAMWVDPDFRGQSIATRILEQSVEIIKQSSSGSHVTKIHYCTSVADGNNRALKLYQKFGFAVDTSPDKDSVVGESVMSMFFDLA